MAGTLTVEETWRAVRAALGQPEPTPLPPSKPPKGYGTWREYMDSLPRRWSNDRPECPPAPEAVVLIPMCSPPADKLNRSMLSLINAVRASEGWRARATYALVELPARARALASGQLRQVDAEIVGSIVVRLAAPDGRRGYVAWENGKFTGAWLTSPRTGVMRYGMRAIMAQVKGEGVS